MRMRVVVSSVAALGVLASGCWRAQTDSGLGGAPSSASSAMASTGSPMGGSEGAGGAGLDVSGTARDSWLTEAGEMTDVPESSLAVSALVPTGSGYATRMGTYDATTGTFVIHDVPLGPYLLEIAPDTFLATSARTFDLGSVRVGRPDAATITKGSPTSLVLDATGLTPWQINDQIALFSLGADASSWPADLFATEPVAGSTSLSGSTLLLSEAQFPGLVDASKGDQTILMHLAGQTLPDLDSYAVTQTTTTLPITLHDGQSTPVSAVFQDLPLQTATVAWQVSAFALLAAAAGPGAKVYSASLLVQVEPAGTETSSIGAHPQLAAVFDDGTADTTVSLAYGNPFPASYGVIGSAYTLYSITEKTPAGPVSWSGILAVQGPVDALFQGPVVPAMAPPTGITVAGLPVTSSDVSGVGQSPLVAWTAPALGTPTRYVVQIYRFGDEPDLVAAITTTETSIMLPPGLLHVGSRYATVITADNAVPDPTAPNRMVTSYAVAQAVTALFTP